MSVHSTNDKFQSLIDGLVIHHKPIKHLYLRFNNQKLQVSAPQGLSEEYIYAFVKSKEQWIKQHLVNREKKPTQNSHQTVGSLPNQFVLLGQSLSIKTNLHAQKNQIILLDKELCLHLKTATPESQYATRQRLLIAHYRKTLTPIIKAFITQYEPLLKVRVSEARTKTMRTRWGTCNISAKRLWFNVFLAAYSLPAIEYVVVHEMVHLLERLHNQRFYSLVSSVMPDWQTQHNNLRKTAPSTIL